MSTILFHSRQCLKNQLPLHFPQRSVGRLLRMGRLDRLVSALLRRTVFGKDRTMPRQQHRPFHDVR